MTWLMYRHNHTKMLSHDVRHIVEHADINQTAISGFDVELFRDRPLTSDI